MLLAAAVLAGLSARGIALTSPSGSRQWLFQALGSGVFIRCAAVMVASVAALIAVCWVCWQAGRRYRPSRDAQGGAVVIEFALALPIALVLVLIMAQSSLLMGGNLCVHYAAYCATRSAIVQIPWDFSPGEPANVLREEAAKMRRIRLAAIWALIPISCSSKSYSPTFGEETTLVGGLGEFFRKSDADVPGWVRRDYLGRKLHYASNKDYTQVTMLRRTGRGKRAPYVPVSYPYTYGENEEVRVAVAHTFYLSVPYAGYLFYRAESAENRQELDFGQGKYGIVIHAATSLTNEGVQDWVDVESFY